MDKELFNPQSSSVSSSRIIYTPSTFARTSLLHLQEVGSLQAVHPHVSQRSDLVSFLCFVVLSGECELSYEGQTYQLSEGDCVFKHADRLETTKELEDRTKIFYCDPMASWQKPKVEKNHEFIRYIIPKGKSMAFLTEEKVILLMNHINSIRRESLGGCSPWQVASEDEDMRVLMNLLNMKEIESDNVLLTPDLLDD